MNKNENEETPGNDILNGIERWMPEPGKKVPKQFKYKSPAGIWYRNKWEAGAVLSRAGVPPEKWMPVPENPWPDVSEKEEEKENEHASE